MPPEGALTLGVLGGGQLGRMFALAAQTMGYRVVVLDPDLSSPAGAVAERQVVAPYLDAPGLAEFADAASAITTEFENVPAQTLRMLALRRPLSPPADAVEICQDRAAEKAHFLRTGVACAPFARIETANDLAQGDTLEALLPGILKTARLGYDGKGQNHVDSLTTLAEVWQQWGRVACVLEKKLPLWRELSVIVARAGDGSLVHLPVQQNLHLNGILAVTQAPAPDVDAATADQAVQQAGRLAASMDYVGVLCVEFFLLTDGSLVANEMAPRPHNSGHYSIDACDVSQFELQVRTLTGLPLVPPHQHSAAVMLNLLGDLWFAMPGNGPRNPDWAAVLALPGVHLHLYGKTEARRGRKMGHLTVTAAEADVARQVALRAAAVLGLPAF